MMNSHLPAQQPPIPLPPSRRRQNDGQYAPPMPHPPQNMSVPMYAYPQHVPAWAMQHPQNHQMMPHNPSPSPHQSYYGQTPMPHHPHQQPMYQPYQQYPPHYAQFQGYQMHNYTPNAQAPMPMPPMAQYQPPMMQYQNSHQRSSSPYYSPPVPPPMPMSMMMHNQGPPMLDGAAEVMGDVAKVEMHNIQNIHDVHDVHAVHEGYDVHMEQDIPELQAETPKEAHVVEVEAPTEPSDIPSTSGKETPLSAVSTAVSSTATPFFPPLPWYSHGEESWVKPRTKKRQPASQIHNVLELPSRPVIETQVPAVKLQPDDTVTPLTSQPPSEIDSTNPTTPSSAVPPSSDSQTTPTSAPASAKQPFRPVIPLFNAQKPAPIPSVNVAAPAKEASKDVTEPVEAVEQTTEQPTEAIEAPKPEPAAPKPSSWAGLFQSAAAKKAEAPANGAPVANGVSRTESMAEALSSFTVGAHRDVTFLEPRGLVNTGNMCYMNAVLQILVFNTLFYNFLDLVGRQTGHNFKSDTPLLDAMIMFMREYNVIQTAASPAELKNLLSNTQLEQYGENLTPDYVYDVIRRLPRFATMRRGHQQDAEEFLGFLLEGLHEECVKSIESAPVKPEPQASGGGEGWFEVGPKQRAAFTQNSGAIITESPVTKIFGGILRSELRVPGLKSSVTYEPYQPLQLDIQSPQVRNITDALRGLTRSETINGEFNSPHGPGVSATKQVFIESLPPVLILHLKRFQYNNTGGAQKIWKKVGYPLELEIPREVLSSSQRNSRPKYRLTGVIYHHGKSASGGHYTVDLLRQDGAEWIRLDDTLIRRVRKEEVAEAGSEEPESRQDEHAGESDESGWKTVSPGENKGSWSAIVNGPPLKPKGREAFVSKDRVAYLLFYSRI